MKRIRCPKCDEAIIFDEAQYEAGRALVFECPECHKQFRIRLPEKDGPKKNSPQPQGFLIVLENAFQLKQEIPLYVGENIIGREVKGTKANAPIRTVDPSIDTTHCIISVQLKKTGLPTFILRDAPSNTGTFLHGEILNDRDRVALEDGCIINIGAATVIFRVNNEQET